MRSLHLYFSSRKKASLLTASVALVTAVHAGTLSVPAVDSYNMRVGTETFAGLYTFTTNTLLVETAEAMTNMGSDVIKFYMGSDTSYQSGVTLPSNVTNLITLARNDLSYQQVLNMPFRHFIMWAYAFGNSDEWWGSGYNTTQGAIDYTEMYELTCYLLTNYNNSGKTFYLGHWEGDGYLNVTVGGTAWATNPSPATISGMIGWLNNRQKAVDDAKAATPHTNVNVFNYAECNRVQDAINNGTNNNERVINYVVPYVTNLDYLSYSSYDSQNLSSTSLYSTLNYMQAHLPTNKAVLVPGERMWIGEYGWGQDSSAAQEPLTRSYIQRLLGWSYGGQCLQYILFWEMYNNQAASLAPATNFCLINPNDIKEPCYYLHEYFLNEAKLLTAQFNETYGALPTDTQFSSLVSPMLNAPLTAPINLTLSDVTASTVNGSSALVSATLAQGVYGDNEAVVSVFWGPQNGGANPGAWANGQVIGVNTNFNPVPFTATLTNLATGTNYYIAFYASNTSAQIWSSTVSIVAGAVPPQLNPANYAYRAKISFPGYLGPSLANFPALVTLSASNVAGLSYNQFQPNGSDLRFTDATGTTMLPFEIDEWNDNGASTIWVQVPVLNSTNVIWAYWGNPNDTDVPPPSSNVWLNAGYEVVYHLKQSGFPFADSTGQFPATKGVAPTPTTGVVGHGGSFNGTSDYISPGAATLSNQFTTYAWIYVNASATNIQTIWANQVGGYGANGFSWFVDTYNTADRITHFDSGNGTGSGADPTGSTTVSTGQWQFVVATWNQDTATVNNYLDGNLNGSGTAVATFGLTNQLNLGAFVNSVYQFNGDMDEARIQSGVASTSWIEANYLNIAQPSSFVSYSGVNLGPPTLVQDITPLTQTVPLYSGRDTVSYSVVVAGGAPFAYQWYQDGTNIAGATNSTYTFTALPGTNTYYVTITNANTASQAGGVPLTSSTATVIGLPAPQLNPGNYSYRAAISFPGYQGQPLTNFPALVTLSASNISGLTYNQFQANGSDLRFTDATGTAMLPYEIDEWNDSGLSTIWVQIPVLGNANIWAYWGNPNDTDIPPPSSNVWLNAGYEIVYHLKQSAFPFADSTGQYPATKGVAPTPTAGVVGHGASFNGTSDYISPGPVTLSNQFTAYAWVYINPAAANEESIWVNQVGGYGSNGFSWFVDSYQTSDREDHLDSGTGTGGSYVGYDLHNASDMVSASQWHFLVATWNQLNTTVSDYVDGVPMISGTAVAGFALTNQLNLGAFLNPTLFFNGDMDEARIQSGLASTNWIMTTYLNISKTSFVGYSSVNPEPILSIALSPNGCVFTWPTNDGTFTLETTTNLAPPAAWAPVTTPAPVLTNGVWQQIVQPAAGSQFYRLQGQ
jgi:hypothetical protein